MMEFYDSNVYYYNFIVSKSKHRESVIAEEEGDVPIIDITPHEPRGKYRK